MALQGNWHRVSRSHPCPVCGRPDWCLYAGPADAPEAAICPRTPDGARKDLGESGHLHVLVDRPRGERMPLPRPEWRPRQPPRDWASIDDKAREPRLTMDLSLSHLAETLGVTRRSLDRIGVGWLTALQVMRFGTHCRAVGCYTFPICSGFGSIIGMGLRTPGGFKYALEGSDGTGIYIPLDMTPAETLWVCEGPTDLAALLDLGAQAVARRSCNSGREAVRGVVARRRPARVVIVTDRDPAGSDAEKFTRMGAESLARLLRGPSPRKFRRLRVAIVQPPEGIKDVRAWLSAGATPAELAALETEAL